MSAKPEKLEGEPFYRIDVGEAKRMIDEQDVQVIDAREIDEHADGHVPGSVRIQHMAVLSNADKLAKNKPIHVSVAIPIFAEKRTASSAFEGFSSPKN